MIDDEKIIEMFFERSEQAIVQHREQQAGRGGMRQRRLLRRMERHSPGTPEPVA